MKNIFVVSILIMFLYSCSKEIIQPEPCVGPNVACWHHIINTWQICPDPNNPGHTYVVSYAGPTTIDSVSVCDTVQWIHDTREWDQWWINFGTDEELKNLKRTYPPSCGCY